MAFNLSETSIKKFHSQKEPPEKIYRTAAIRMKCLECCGGTRKAVDECTDYKCPLWGYRLKGKYVRPPVDGWQTKKRALLPPED